MPGTAIMIGISVVTGETNTGTPDPGNTLLLNTGDDILLNTGDFLLTNDN